MILFQHQPRVLALLAGLMVFPISSQGAYFGASVTVVTSLPGESKLSPENCETTMVNTTGQTRDYRVVSNVQATPILFTLASKGYQVIRCRAPEGTDIQLKVVCVDSPERPCVGG